ncbi:MAG: 2-oxoacid:ferredoxin oxidoreductase subunit alpha [Candidatus Micrarchaeia archaeon]
MQLSWLIGGAQGLGVDTSANIFGDAVAKSGYYLYGSREYYSNIKGRHSYFTVMIGDKMMNSISENVNILATFDSETVFQHFYQAKDFIIYNKGLEATQIEMVRSMEPEIIMDSEAMLEKAGLGTTLLDAVKYAQKKGAKPIAIDYVGELDKIINALKISPPIAERAKNIIAISATYALLGLDKKHMLDAVQSRFSKSETFLKLNLMAVDAGFRYANNFYNLKDIDANKAVKRIQADGNTLSAIGKVSGGLRFQSYYPITPASDESTYIEANQILSLNGTQDKGGVVVLQTEDELAAINAAIGAALTGARAATATSGPGFSLMSEGISWAGMNEVPVLISYYMRGAPATGLPTRSGQADLKFALNVGHGEFPRIVIASGSHKEIFSDASWALNLAEKYQTPTIHIMEKTLANAYSIINVDDLNIGSVKIDRGKLETDLEDYKRFKMSEDGISPRAFLGQARMFYTGDEHNAYGHIDESVTNRTNMYKKRLVKLDTADREIPQEMRLKQFGDQSSDTALLTWGSPSGVIADTMEDLNKAGISALAIQVKMFNPYPKELMQKLLAGKKRIIAIENNYYAQGAEVLTEKTGIMPTNYILKLNGRPIMREEFIEAMKTIMQKGEKTVILNGGA